MRTTPVVGDRPVIAGSSIPSLFRGRFEGALRHPAESQNKTSASRMHIQYETYLGLIFFS